MKLVNASFEDGFHNHMNIGELTVANGWTPFYDESSGKHRAEYRPERAGVGRGRIREGEYGQKWFTTFSAHDGGLYQTVENVTPGKIYEFSAWVYVWSSQKDNPDVSQGNGKVSVVVGINPWGNEDAYSYQTTYGMEALNVYNKWVHLWVRQEAFAPKLTVSLRSIARFGVTHNDAYWDACELREWQPAPSPQPEPEPQPVPTTDVNELARRTVLAFRAAAKALSEWLEGRGV